MADVYVSGPLTGQPNVDTLKAFYEKIGEICLHLGMQPYIPHQHSDPIFHSELSPEYIYNLDREKVAKANLVVAYVGLPSTGVGLEIEIARQHNIPVILIYETGRAVSRMVRGSPAIIAEVVGSDLKHVLEKLQHVLMDLDPLANLQQTVAGRYVI